MEPEGADPGSHNQCLDWQPLHGSAPVVLCVGGKDLSEVL